MIKRYIFRWIRVVQTVGEYILDALCELTLNSGKSKVSRTRALLALTHMYVYYVRILESALSLSMSTNGKYLANENNRKYVKLLLSQIVNRLVHWCFSTAAMQCFALICSRFDICNGNNIICLLFTVYFGKNKR